MKVFIIYVTVGTLKEAQRIGNQLVKDRLAAGINIIDNVNSIYWWNDEINYNQEVVMIAKTKESLIEELIATIKFMHSYDCPCILQLPIVNGDPQFLDWIISETKFN